VVYRNLHDTIRKDMTLEELICAFEQMCDISVGDPDDLLFETGTYDYTGEDLFYFSLVRQFKFSNDDEYVQLRLDIMYTPIRKTALIQECEWGEPSDGVFFEMVRQSRAFNAIQSLPIKGVQLRVDDT